MGKVQLKQEIDKRLENLPESVLLDLLALISHLEHHPQTNIKSFKDTLEIIEDDKELLKKLAE